ncbi:MAG: hypothetical protein HY053_02500 [Proteobacteria bacterium]|nr:hypothetical protein [Pseudomonadota bacterium]
MLFNRFLFDQRGTIIALWAMLLPLMAGMGGLALDAGNWYMNARDLQSAADASVLTAAYKSGQGSTTNLTTLVENEMARNGYSTGVNVVVNSPPAAGSYTNDLTAVEALVSVSSHSFLASALGVQGSTITARAVARRNISPSNACILALNSSALDAVDVGGSAVLTSGKCVMASNSTTSSSISIGGNSDLTLNSMYSAGNIHYYGNYTVDLSSPAQTFRTPLDDPYAGLSVPTASATCASTTINRHGSTTFQPGTYCNGIKLVSGNTVTLNSGTYILQGNFDIGAQASISGSDVTIILEGKNGNYGSVKINGGSTVNLTAQTSGTYKGLVMMEDRNAPSSTKEVFNGGASMTLQGGLYFPSADVQFNGNNGQNVSCLQLVASTISFSGTSNFNDDCDSFGTEKIPLPGSVVLAE